MALIEGELEENVKKFPVLFDKSNYDFHGKDRKTAWTNVAKSSGTEDGRLCLK